MAADTYLVITDGTTTVTFEDGSGGATNYSVASDGWAPQVSGLRRSLLGGRGPYEEVIESLEINITGSSVPNCLANKETLATLLEQAERWSNNESVSPVILKYSPKGATTSSVATPLQAVILGRAPGDMTAMALPVNFEFFAGSRTYIVRMRLAFVRRGLWLGATDSVTTAAVSSTFRAHGAFASSIGLMLPVQITIDDLSPGAALAIPASYILAARNKSGTSDVTGAYLQDYAASTMTATGYTAFNDSANLPRGGTNVLRYTPTGTAFVASGSLTLTSPITTSRRVAVYATLRKNTAARTFQVYGEFISNTALRAIQTGTLTIDNTVATTTPLSYHIGTVSLPVDQVNLPNVSYPTFKLYINVDSTAGSPTFDIDALVFLGLDDEAGHAVGIQAFTIPNLATQDIVAGHNSLTRPDPDVILSIPASSQTDTLGYEGDPWFNTILDRITLCWIATRGAFWRYTVNAGTVGSQTFTALRYRGYLTPV